MVIRNFSLSQKRLPNVDDYIEFISVAETCVVVHVDSELNILLVRQYREIFDSYTLELPGGGREAGEESAACAIREFREETGIQLDGVRPLTSAALSVGTSDEVVSVFVARGAEVQVRTTPQLECRWVPLRECFAILAREKVRDAKTLLGVALAQGSILSA
jgi:ADP-ribose pyrophosphatase